ncbi:hypothetical protein I6E74_03695 [Salinibacterium sp. SWN139]|uniref:hypothetical protein n=1 Tax=Salinibacterium sp. SWN139 TaxID=2792055 RepID=UPI0018CE8EB2|nr:hypothetical protein [Salinibacterium sp. SWN139]MBH0053271.1 hypothetical protein [Salinibacterium sp. SWN139]
MTLTRMWTLIGAVAVIIILLAGYAIGVAPALADVSSADEEIIAVEAQNQVKQNELDALKALAENSEGLFADLAEVQKSVPSAHGTSVFAEQLATLAEAAGVTIVDISYVTATDAIAPEAEPVESTQDADAEESDADAGGEAAAPEVQPGAQAVQSVPGLVALGVDVNATGSYDDLNKFLESVQLNDRSFSVTTVSVQGDGTSDLFEISLSGVVYVLVDSATAFAVSGNGTVS